jgi:hypothetical protein
LPELPKDKRLEQSGRLYYYAGNEDLRNKFVSPIFGDFGNVKTPFLVQGE